MSEPLHDILFCATVNLCLNVLFVSLFVSMFYFSPTRLPYSGDLILNFSIDLSFETLGVVYRWSECRQWWWSVACEVIWKWMWGVNEWLGSVMPSWYIEFTFGILKDLDSKIVGSGPWPVAMTFFHFNFTFFGVGPRKMSHVMDLLYCSLARSWAKVELLVQLKHGLWFFFFTLQITFLRAQFLKITNKIIFIN